MIEAVELFEVFRDDPWHEPIRLVLAILLFELFEVAGLLCGEHSVESAHGHEDVPILKAARLLG
ncbi:hypothetical protein D3C85_1475030 [compost metagenome]